MEIYVDNILQICLMWGKQHQTSVTGALAWKKREEFGQLRLRTYLHPVNPSQ